MHILIRLHQFRIPLLITFVAGALTVTACSGGDPADDLTDTDVSTENVSDIKSPTDGGGLDVLPLDASTDDVSTDDASSNDVSPHQNDEEESQACGDISDSDECRETDGCSTYITYKVDPEIFNELEGSCMENFDEIDPPLIVHCQRINMSVNNQEFGHIYARYNAEADEYEIHILPTDGTSYTRSQNGFVSCYDIPTDEYPEDRETCFKCRGVTDPEAD